MRFSLGVISTWKPPSASDPRMGFVIGDVLTDPLEARFWAFSTYYPRLDLAKPASPPGDPVANPTRAIYRQRPNHLSPMSLRSLPHQKISNTFRQRRLRSNYGE